MEESKYRITNRRNVVPPRVGARPAPTFHLEQMLRREHRKVTIIDDLSRFDEISTLIWQHYQDMIEMMVDAADHCSGDVEHPSLQIYRAAADGALDVFLDPSTGNYVVPGSPFLSGLPEHYVQKEDDGGLHDSH